MMRGSVRPAARNGLLLWVLTALAPAQAVTAPLTRAEASGFQETSRHADVIRFVDALRGLPFADRLRVASLGTSGERRNLPLIIATSAGVQDLEALHKTDLLRVLVLGNIHAGEVEGKEALQMILREFALGSHGDLLRNLAVIAVPIFNADGNEQISRENRVSQNGPDHGVGRRPNASGLDLNRDFIKLESPECRALVGAFESHDPHVFLDLHATNGSEHGYHLTYAPSLCTNVDSALDAFTRGRFLPSIRSAMGRWGFEVFDYGNFAGRGQARRWTTYDHRPRFGTNYFGLRNRIALLSEAYSYLSFKERVQVTRAFVLEVLRAAAEARDEIRTLCRQADQRVLDEDLQFHYETSLVPPSDGEVLVGRVERLELQGLGTRRVSLDERKPERMPIQVAFASKKRESYPSGWAILGGSELLQETLLRHGVEVSRLTEACSISGQRFLITERREAKRTFQGHQEITLTGRFEESTLSLPPGALVVSARQRLARIAAELLEPRSEDGLATWNFFDGQIGEATDATPANHPVVRLGSWPKAPMTPLTMPESR